MTQQNIYHNKTTESNLICLTIKKNHTFLYVVSGRTFTELPREIHWLILFSGERIVSSLVTAIEIVR